MEQRLARRRLPRYRGQPLSDADTTELKRHTVDRFICIRTGLDSQAHMSSSNANERSEALSKTSSPSRGPDAGLKGLDHYERRLPRWRHKLRQRLIPIVRLETPYLAWLQQTFRSPFLDSYFAITANLGTHTFFMLALPICFWCGYPQVGVALVQMLALGVYWSGYVKDLICLPRPLSPPLQRITMSGSVALEYGWPSTHTTNAVSVAVFCLYQLSLARDSYEPLTYNVLRAGCYAYASSITLGRVYCGMHGFFDVVCGALLGAIIGWWRVMYGPVFDAWTLEPGWQNSAVVAFACCAAIRYHPEPADNCPCFDDSVAFTSVVMGVTLGVRHFTGTDGTYAGSLSVHDWLHPSRMLGKAAIRIVGGVIIVFAWRAVAKPTLLRSLPPIFRFVDHWGFRLPRRYFLQARYYNRVPPLREDDNILPKASEIPGMLSSIGRTRAVSIGPQSEADARESMAIRAQQRRNSRSKDRLRMRNRPPNPQPGSTLPLSPAVDESTVMSPTQEGLPDSGTYFASQLTQDNVSKGSLQVNATSDLLTPPPSDDGGRSSDSEGAKEDTRQDRAIFLALEKPRIRYDVEVITKVVVYVGIAWLAVEGNPLLFEHVGLI